jgi:hypothetical protein
VRALTGRDPTATTYDPGTDSWSSADSVNRPRLGHVAVALADGRVLVIDGAWDGSCELYA